MNEFIKRTIWAVILSVTVITAILYLDVLILKLSIAVISVLAVYEISALLDTHLKGLKNKSILIVAFFSSISIIFLDFYLGLFIITLYSFWLAHKHSNLNYLTWTLFSLVYGVFFVSSLAFIIEYERLVLFLLFAVVWSGDTLAYIIGKNFGKHKMAPVISPKKTWEGALGSFIGSVTAGYAFIYYFHLPYHFFIPVFLSAIFLQVGDLFESFIKRQVGKKDSSNLIPGHGGLLDRIDSLIFSSVLFFIWINLSTKFLKMINL